MNTNITETLKQSSTGLMMMSESEYPFEVISWANEGSEPITTKRILQLTNHPQDSLIEEVELEHLFRNSAFEREWHDELQKQEVVKFQTLLNALKDNLKEIKVYRVGSTNIDVYIIGKTSTDDLAGLSTKAIET
jgi:hypothetical protein